jgi:hypothetical protein
MTVRATFFLALLIVGYVPALRTQTVIGHRSSVVSPDNRRLKTDDFFRRDLPHYGKWLTAAGTVAFTVMAASEHRQSRREWNALLDICRSSEQACEVGPDGRYLRGDAEQRYQRSRVFDKRANRWLLGAQGSLLLTTALFIIDLHPGEGPDNIPFPGGLAVTPLPNGAAVGLRIAF